MSINDLLETVDDPNFISGIYNYCDRWCERCAFTTRCFLYATERADPELDDPQVRDIDNAKFWRKLESIFKDTHELIAKWAAEAGIDLESFEVADATAEREDLRRDAKEHPLSLSARRYAEIVQHWFNEEFAVEVEVHDDVTGQSKSVEDDIDVTGAAEVIRWYQFFIAAKTYRALMGLEDQRPDNDLAEVDVFTDNELSDDAIILRAAADDSNGSAKIALIGIDRSSSAWRVMQSSLPEKTDSIFPIMVELGRLRQSLEETFPNARDFLRPGFDEVGSDSMN